MEAGYSGLASSGGSAGPGCRQGFEVPTQYHGAIASRRGHVSDRIAHELLAGYLF